MWYIAEQQVSREVPMSFRWVSWTPPPPALETQDRPQSQHSPPCVAPVISFSRDTLLEVSMMLRRWSGAKSLRDALVSKLFRIEIRVEYSQRWRSKGRSTIHPKIGAHYIPF